MVTSFTHFADVHDAHDLAEIKRDRLTSRFNHEAIRILDARSSTTFAQFFHVSTIVYSTFDKAPFDPGVAIMSDSVGKFT